MGSGQTNINGDATRIIPINPPDASLPVMSCYISSNPYPVSDVWLAVTDGDNTLGNPVCGLSRNGAGQWVVVLLSAPPGWYYYFAVVF